MIYGIICEFNPFHSGHKYLFDSIKKENDKILAVMSGNFVQRGEFAIFDKYQRAKEAVINGADLVIELPTPYSTLSAEGFAKFSVSLIESTGIVDKLAFGAEKANIDALKEVAYKLKEETTQNAIALEMKKGISYPAARENVIGSDLLKSPNNNLAIEYLRFAKIGAVAVERIGKGHDTDDKEYSASEIRKNIVKSSADFSSIYNCEKAVLAKLRTMTATDFLKITDVSDGLENRIVSAVRNAKSLDELYELIATKRFTQSRIRRIILRAYLGIEDEYNNDIPYIKVLAFNKNGQKMLKDIKNTVTIPIITKYGDSKSLTEYGKKLYDFECVATDLYTLGYKEPKLCGEEQRSTVFTDLK